MAPSPGLFHLDLPTHFPFLLLADLADELLWALPAKKLSLSLPPFPQQHPSMSVKFLIRLFLSPLQDLTSLSASHAWAVGTYNAVA